MPATAHVGTGIDPALRDAAARVANKRDTAFLLTMRKLVMLWKLLNAAKGFLMPKMPMTFLDSWAYQCSFPTIRHILVVRSTGAAGSE